MKPIHFSLVLFALFAFRVMPRKLRSNYGEMLKTIENTFRETAIELHERNKMHLNPRYRQIVSLTVVSLSGILYFRKSHRQNLFGVQFGEPVPQCIGLCSPILFQFVIASLPVRLRLNKLKSSEVNYCSRF